MPCRLYVATVPKAKSLRRRTAFSHYPSRQLTFLSSLCYSPFLELWIRLGNRRLGSFLVHRVPVATRPKLQGGWEDDLRVLYSSTVSASKRLKRTVITQLHILRYLSFQCHTKLRISSPLCLHYGNYVLRDALRWCGHI